MKPEQQGRGTSSFLRDLLRRWPLLLVGIVAGAGAGYLVSTVADDAPATYDTRALVVATRWEQRIEGLPRLVETVLETNDFEDQVRMADPEAFPGSVVVLDVVDAVPIQDTVAVWIEADAPSAEVAAARANVAAEALVSELNRLGADIGSFALQDRARPPEEESSSQLSPVERALIGGLGGLAIAAGIAAVWPRRKTREPASQVRSDVDETARGDDDRDEPDDVEPAPAAEAEAPILTGNGRNPYPPPLTEAERRARASSPPTP